MKCLADVPPDSYACPPARPVRGTSAFFNLGGLMVDFFLIGAPLLVLVVFAVARHERRPVIGQPLSRDHFRD
jgi:hypothetical protein